MTLFLTVCALGYVTLLATLLAWLVRHTPPVRPASRPARARRAVPLEAANDDSVTGWMVRDPGAADTVSRAFGNPDRGDPAA